MTNNQSYAGVRNFHSRAYHPPGGRWVAPPPKPEALKDAEVLSQSMLDILPFRERQLLVMLTYMRPAWTETEAVFIDKFIRPIGAKEDGGGNLWVKIAGKKGGKPKILWSCHTDTVHYKSGVQSILLGDGFVTAESSNCLGADCTVGVWLMINMIRAAVPGIYVFHGGEEKGGIGSSHIAKNTSERLKGIDFAIAFDRKGTNEIITHQHCGRTASDAFAESLAVALYPMPFAASTGGTFTDTANYAGMVPECTNISVGYYNQHQPTEYLDVKHACDLLDRLLTADFSRLVVARDPGGYDLPPAKVYNYGMQSDCYDYMDYPYTSNRSVIETPSSPTDNHLPLKAEVLFERDELDEPTTFGDFVQEYPDEIAAFLTDLGYGMDDVRFWMWSAGLIENPTNHDSSDESPAEISVDTTSVGSDGIPIANGVVKEG